MAKADSKEAHQALEKLLADLRKINLTGMSRRGSGNPRALSQTAEQWVDTLERAAAEIPEWCDSFSIDESPRQT